MKGFIFPPRPKSAIPPHQLNRHEKSGVWVAQHKYNGSRNIIKITSNRHVFVWSRHGSQHKIFNLDEKTHNELLTLPGLEKGKEYCFDSEVLTKTKNKNTKNKIIIFDILQLDKYLFMKPDQMKRLAILSQICGNPEIIDPWLGMAYFINLKNGSISENVLMAPTFESDFFTHFNEIQEDEVEGLLLRKKKSVIDNFGQKEYEVGWMLRCRRNHKNYSF